MLDQSKLQMLAERIEKESLERLISNNLDCEANRVQCKTHTHEGQKYTRVDIGSSGRYMVVNATGEIFGIKAYGVIHKGHYYGTLETIDDYYWGEYQAFKRVAVNA